MVEISSGHEGYTQQLQHHLRGVLRNKATGKSNTDYSGLLQEIATLKTAAFVGGHEGPQHDLSSLLDVLVGCISALHGQRHAGLISEVFSISLWDAIKELRSSVLCFMLHLAVVNSTATLQILQVLVLNLGLPWALAAQEPDIMGKEWSPSPRVKTIQDDIVGTLEKILELVPVSASLLLPVLARGLPNKVLPRCIQCTYLRGMLRIAELPRAAPIRRQILAGIVQHLVSLDVEIRWQDIAFSLDEIDEDEEEAETQEDEQEDIFELEGQREELQLDPSKFNEQPAEQLDQASAGNRVTGRSGFEGKAKDEAPSTSGREQIDETAEKLDSMMTQVFQYISRCQQSGQLVTTWQALLDSFFITVLNTHRSKFTQYLLWYILDMDAEKGSREFLGKLLQVLADSRQPAITRSASASYVASLLARAAFLSDGLLIDHILRLASWCSNYCQQHELESSRDSFQEQRYTEAPPQGVVHQVFYAACQGLLYVLCYRLEQLAGSMADGVRDGICSLFQTSIPQLLQSRLAPMAICLPTVVAEFTKLTARLGLLDCKALLPGNAEAAQWQRPLEMFFPFDPYLLRRSAAFLDLNRTFLRWRGGHAGAQGDEPDEEEEEEEEISAHKSESLSGDDADSGSSSSGLGSASDAESSQLESDQEDLADAFQDLTPDDASPVAVWQTVSQPIRPRERSPNFPASHSTNGNSSPSCPMSWTPKLPQNFANHRQPLVRPLD